MAHERLDYALSKTAEWPRIATMWGNYIALHPEDGRAYDERGGTFMQMRNFPASLADSQRGCELGVSAARAYAARLGASLHSP